MALTPSQIQAIEARGNVIVVAGAGTGKTSTLVERCVSLIKEGCSIENILMVTFTEAAAAEMRHRLRLRLAEASVSSDSNAAGRQWLEEQLALLDSARICTLHSFCLQLIRENFHLLGMDPAVRVLDGLQSRPLMESALNSTLEPHLERTDEVAEAVRELIRRYGQGDVERIRGTVLKLHRYAQSLEAPEQWFAEQLAALEQTDPGMWQEWFEAGVKIWAGEWLPELEKAADGVVNLLRCARAVRELSGVSNDVPSQSEEGACEVTAAGRLKAPLDEILAADAEDWPKKRKGVLRAPFKKFFEEAEFLASQLENAGNEDVMAADRGDVRGCMRALVCLAQEFGAEYAAAKRGVGGIDFSDLEQLALRLLREVSGQPTPVAKQWKATLHYVFVDECQDINAAQDAILNAVSRHSAKASGPDVAGCASEGRLDDFPASNRFLVGDVKQSIYQFRLARPELFRDCERAWKDGAGGRRIPLSENFRSAPGIIRFVNALFQPLMRDDVGGVEYEELVAGRVDGLATGNSASNRAEPPEGVKTGTVQDCVEFHLIPKMDPEQARGEDEAEDGGEVEDLSAVEKEARLVAGRLAELHRSGLEIWDKEYQRMRRVEWRDMAVLLRSPANRVEAFAKEFHNCGVPLQAARGGFLQATEIVDILSLFRILDNPLQDIPLLAVLRSPLVALTLDELAMVRLASDSKRFWTVLNAFHRAGPGDSGGPEAPAWEKIDWFLAHYGQWRELARQSSLSHCLEKVLAATHYDALLGAGDRGAERVANVRKLGGMLRQFDPHQRQGLFRFLKFVDAIEAAEEDIEPAPAQTQNAVRLMSIHQSKGLEFPVVVIACLGGQFNLGDLSQDILLDEQFGLCAKVVQTGSGTRYPTLPHWVASRRQRRRILGEELRLLYVAATRARDRLLLIATATRKDCEAWESVKPRSFATREILTARSPLDWLLLWLPTATRTEDWNGGGGAGEWLRWTLWHQVDRAEPPAEEWPRPAAAVGLEAGDADAVIARIRWSYAHAAATAETAKTSVTALRRKAAGGDDENARTREFSKPDPARNAGGISAIESGTLHHRFLQRMSLHGACDEADLRAQMDAMVETGGLQKAEAEVLDLAALARFWQGDTGSRIRSHAAKVRRELPFTARFTPTELAPITGGAASQDLAEEYVVVQGVADLVVMLENELLLLDYKTDDVKLEDIPEKAALYRPQIGIYAAALARIHGKAVTRRWLHFIKAGKTLEM